MITTIDMLETVVILPLVAVLSVTLLQLLVCFPFRPYSAEERRAVFSVFCYSSGMLLLRLPTE